MKKIALALMVLLGTSFLLESTIQAWPREVVVRRGLFKRRVMQRRVISPRVLMSRRVFVGQQFLFLQQRQIFIPQQRQIIVQNNGGGFFFSY